MNKARCTITYLCDALEDTVYAFEFAFGRPMSKMRRGGFVLYSTDPNAYEVGVEYVIEAMRIAKDDAGLIEV